MGTASPGGIHVVPNEEGAAAGMAPQDWEGGGPSLPMWSGKANGRTHRLVMQPSPGRMQCNRIEGTETWEDVDLDGKIWASNEEGGDDEENQVDGIERFFDYLAYHDYLAYQF